MKSLIELRTPVIALGLCCEFPLLIGEVRSDEIYFDEGTEHTTLYHPLEVICSNH